ncbi:hypothetical protein HK104_002868, partial [Borealophlyctis nickersoniae]
HRHSDPDLTSVLADQVARLQGVAAALAKAVGEWDVNVVRVLEEAGEEDEQVLERVRKQVCEGGRAERVVEVVRGVKAFFEEAWNGRE